MPDGLENAPLKTVTPILLRIANLPYRVIPASRRRLPWSELTNEDRWKIILMRLPSVAAFMASIFALDPNEASNKDVSKYLPMMYRGLRYPRLARNVSENREQVARRLHDQSTKTVMSTYRAFRPRFLNYVVEVEVDGRRTFEPECRPVTEDDLTPFVMVCYSSAHYNLSDENEHDDMESLLAVSTKAAVKYFQLEPGSVDLNQTPRAFWTSANFIPPNKVVGTDGTERIVDGLEQEMLANQDTYSISDIIRAAQHVIVVADNLSHDWDPNALRVWGQRVWTLPEVILSRGNTVTAWHCGRRTTGRQLYSIVRIEPNRQTARASTL